MIEIGDKVVCIKKGEWNNKGNIAPNGCPQYGEICVVNGFFVQGGKIALRIVGRPLLAQDGDYGGYWIVHFRKLDELKQSRELEYLRNEPARAQAGEGGE